MGFMDRGLSPHRPPNTPYKPDEDLDPMEESLHPVIHAERVAVITGAASGIGRAAAIELAKLGLRLALADVNEDGLREVAKKAAKFVGEANILVIPTDVSKIEEVVKLRERVLEQWGEIAVLLNNAGIGNKSASWTGLDTWRQLFEVNLFGIINVQQTFVPYMLNQENPCVIVNTGSKQGITNPPGNPGYNATKAAVKSVTESLSHELKQVPNCPLTAHLFVPGWTHTGLSSSSEKPPGAWTAQQTVLYMLDRLRIGEFYIMVPDNETTPAMDALRVMWAAGDITEGRPALSRWDPAYKTLFNDYMRDSLAILAQKQNGSMSRERSIVRQEVDPEHDNL